MVLNCIMLFLIISSLSLIRFKSSPVMLCCVMSCLVLFSCSLFSCPMSLRVCISLALDSLFVTASQIPCLLCCVHSGCFSYAPSPGFDSVVWSLTSLTSQIQRTPQYLLFSKSPELPLFLGSQEHLHELL